MATSAPAPGLQRKLKKVLETRAEAPELAASLATLSTFFADNTTVTRRHLRSTIENEGLKVNEEFIAAAEDIIGALDAVQQDLDRVAACCEGMNNAILENKTSTAGLLLETERLQKALNVSQMRSELLGEFLDQYQLSPAEMQALQSENMSHDFFAALEHVRSIHSNCKTLLRTHHQRAGLELLDSMASLQEGAFERLCRWVQRECRALADTDSSEVNPLLQEAATALRGRPVLFKYCAEEVATARQSALFQRFIRALTRGPRPIEMHAPDPWRYASDMLAWVHTSLASEREFLISLLGEDTSFDADAKRSEGAIPSDDVERELSREDKPMTIPQLLDGIFEGIARPLRVRLEQVLMSSPPPALCFRLSQLLTFYLDTVDGMLGLSSQLSDALRACRAMAMRMFYETLRHRGEKLSRYPPPPPSNLSLPPQLAEGATLVSDLVESYETSLLTTSQAASPNKDTAAKSISDDTNDVDIVLAAVIDPLIKAIDRSAEALNPKAAGRLDDGSHLNPTDYRIYMINSLYALQRPLLGHVCGAKRLKILQAAIEEQISNLAGEEADKVLLETGVGPIAARLQLYNATEPGDECGVPAADAQLTLPRVSETMRKFFGKLSDPAALPDFPKLQVPLLKAEAVQQSLFALADAYEGVYNTLISPGNGYQQAEVVQMVPHTPAQVKTLLGVDCRP